MSTNFNTQKTEESTNVWLTPRPILDLLGEFDTDPCAATIRPWDCATTYNYTVEDNGLAQEWHGRVWLNPPYGREAEAFMRKMSEHNGSGLALVFVRTDTRWFHATVLNKAKYLFFFKGRIKFCRPNGVAHGNQPNAPSCLVAWSEEELPLLLRLQSMGLGKIAILKGGES